MSVELQQDEYSGLDELLTIENSMPRYNGFIVDKFINNYDIGNNTEIVDFGAGIGTLSQVIHEKTGISPSCIEIDKINKSYLVDRGFSVFDDIEEIGNLVDVVFSSNVLEHIEDDLGILKKIFGRLNENGIVFLYLPAFQMLYSGLDSKVGHYRRYNKKNLLQKVRACGFEVTHCEYADSIGFFASIVIKIFGYGGEHGIGSQKSLKFYDRYLLGISALLDSAGIRFLLGKNIFLIARKPAVSNTE